MRISSDVNTVFAYNDPNHIYHRVVFKIMTKSIRQRYVMLANVKNHFIYTYKDYLEEASLAIDLAIREYKSQRLNTSYKPSSLSVSINVDALIKKHLEKREEECNFNTDVVRKFINIILTKYPIPAIYEDDEQFAKFREEYLKETEKTAISKLNNFFNFFKDREGRSLGDYKNYGEWLKYIKNSKSKVFNNKRDYEDMCIAAEIFAYHEEYSTFNFYSADSECVKSIKAIAKEYSVNIGKMIRINF